nr:anthocyanidin 3-O-glucosyltransferase 2-like [Tanacetum cinerariifolium]
MVNTVAHLVFIPAPGIGHIISAIEMAKLLVNRDQRFSITVLIIKPPNVSSVSAMTSYIESLANQNMGPISFIEVPQDKTPPPLSHSKSPVTFFIEFISGHCNNVKNVVADMISQPDFGRFAGFVIDTLCTSMIDVANEFNIPTYVFFTSNAAFLGFVLYLPTLFDSHDKDVIELSNSDTEIPIPSFVKPVPTKVFPNMFLTREDVDLLVWSLQKHREVKGIVVNTFFELETHAIKSLSTSIGNPPVYPVGPILNLEAGGGAAGKSSDNDVIGWLDNQPPSSVVFLCFGSMGFFDEIQVKEIANALEHSGHHFLWSLRQPPSDQTSKVPTDYEDARMVLPKGFLERTAGIGRIIGWAPQVMILAHQAIGGFVSHCGWNSILESLWFGVPLATWPIYAEQQINAFEMVAELGLAVEIKLDYKKDLFSLKADSVIVSADEIESGIRRLMEDHEVRTKVKEMSKKSRTTVAEDGSSYASVGYLIQDLIRNMT